MPNMPILQALPLSVWHKVRLHWTLTKPRLSLVVVFSAVMGALIAGLPDWWIWPLLLVGGYGITAAANIANQILERETDKWMTRTAGRPLPAGLLSIRSAFWAFCIWAGIGGLSLAMIGWRIALLGSAAMALYAIVYTPLKRVGPIAVLVGAIPGALPPAIGYLASRFEIDETLWVLFVVQFLWQFPHFGVIAWMSRADYRRAGFYLLPFSHDRANEWLIATLSGVLMLSGLVVWKYVGWVPGLWTGILSAGVIGLALAFARCPTGASAHRLLMGLTLFLTLFYMGLWVWPSA